jgi:hypothetical protein
MMINFAKQHKTNYNISTRKNFRSNEIFATICSIYVEFPYSAQLDYLTFKNKYCSLYYTKLKNRCILTSKARLVTKHLKINQMSIASNVSFGNFAGFYNGLW